jgi:hypothetical protein
MKCHDILSLSAVRLVMVKIFENVESFYWPENPPFGGEVSLKPLLEEPGSRIPFLWGLMRGIEDSCI